MSYNAIVQMSDQSSDGNKKKTDTRVALLHSYSSLWLKINAEISTKVLWQT